MSATPAEFGTQLDALRRRYVFVSLEQVLEAHRGGTPLPPRALLLSFDDAYWDFAAHAWPALAARGLPVTLFVPTAFPGDPHRGFWWDRLYRGLVAGERREPLDVAGDAGPGPLPLATRAEREASFRRLRDRVKALPHDDAMALVERTCDALGDAARGEAVLSWDALRTLAAAGVSLAAHSRSHPLVDRLPPARVREEAEGSLDDLRREIGEVPAVFAYPAGGFDDASVAVLRDAGFELAFTTRPGAVDLRRDDPLRLRRFGVGPRTTRAVLRSQLLVAAPVAAR